MRWKTKRGYSDKKGVSKDEYWEIVSAWLGLRDKQVNSFIAKFFEDYINGKELRVGYVRQLVGSRGSINYLSLEEYFPEDYTFTISVSMDYRNENSKYLVIKNEIVEIDNGSRWNIKVSEKRDFSTLFSGGLSSNLDHMFHGQIHFDRY